MENTDATCFRVLISLPSTICVESNWAQRDVRTKPRKTSGFGPPGDPPPKGRLFPQEAKVGFRN
jgi:hypothetical protein